VGTSDWVNIVCPSSRVKGEQPHTRSLHEPLCYSLGRLIFSFDFFPICFHVSHIDRRRRHNPAETTTRYSRYLPNDLMNIRRSVRIEFRPRSSGRRAFSVFIFPLFQTRKMISENRFREPSLLGRGTTAPHRHSNPLDVE